ncbi:MAG: Acetyl-/propionyl-coenzyme A carboxylase alpha chain [Alphaproteobacteria bacterium MarineAlpha9_Bin7]|nr:MAG: Acetyl-/propionyl-coenzyme A carboxylase alpha chain [Alphaproteobacteria bacterium MarineAlpha9_Bin7]
MKISALLIANRGEIAIRIARAARDLGLKAVAVYSEDDANSLHTQVANKSYPLKGNGPKAYLDMDAIFTAAQEMGCDAIHPGYGFLAERAAFADRCANSGLLFVGPNTEHLDLFGDKAKARTTAASIGLPVLRGLDRAITLDDAKEFFEQISPSNMMIKAIAGGGGRGTRVVTAADNIESAYERCRSESKIAFGQDGLYVEEFISRARHIEVQIVGDKNGNVAHLGERECSFQRRFQKIIEVAPAPNLSNDLRTKIIDTAMQFAEHVRYTNLGTFEFLVDLSHLSNAQPFIFIEANARLQVEHTVTEEVMGVDLVQTQIRLADGASLDELELNKQLISEPRGYAIETRVNMETYEDDGSVRPATGTLSVYEAPNGPGVRTDGFGYAGYHTSNAFDSLLAKVICHSPTKNFRDAVLRSMRALSEFRLKGVNTNIQFLQNILNHDHFAQGKGHTRWVDEHLTELLSAPTESDQHYASIDQGDTGIADGHAGAKIESRDPLALFAYDAEVKASLRVDGAAGDQLPATGPDGSVGLTAPIQGTIISLDVALGEQVQRGQQLAVVEAMKMEHVISAKDSGVVRKVTMAQGDVVREGHPILFIEKIDGAGDTDDNSDTNELDLDYIRPDLKESIDRHSFTLDENRPEAVAKRRARGYRMPRENIAQLVDLGSFQEYWPLIVAKQHQRHDIETLRKNSPADGVVAGTASINGKYFDDQNSRALVVSYDYTVLAGTQGRRNHYKQDRLYDLANRFRLPIVLFSEGGGGRPGDDDTGPRVAFDTHTFTQFSKLSGLVPLIGVNNGRCFAGNTALLACCDIIIATEGSTIAMGGPAMIEGGGLGIYTPEEVGPMSFQVPNGVVDILVEDEEEAVDVAKKYLSYFQGPINEWEAPDQRKLRHIVPENRVRLYDMREIIQTIADTNSVLEIREKFGIGIITSFVRVEGKPMGVVANNPHHLAGAIDSDAADKGARFLQLCDAFDIPVLSLMDCPGIMVGPEAEKTALVRHCVRMFNAGANLTTPLFGVVVRKAYGLGVQAMCGASSLVGFFTVAWPTAEFAGMNIEGAVKLGHRNEIAAIEDPAGRRHEFDRRVEEAYESARAVNAGTGGGLDDVIDPAETRTWITNSLRRLPPIPSRTGKKYNYIDTW